MRESNGEEEGRRGKLEIGKTKGQLKGYMDTWYSRSLFKYIHIRKKSKWNHQLTAETKPQLDISHHELKPPVPEIDNI